MQRLNPNLVKQDVGQLLRFVVVGLFSTAVNYAVFALLLYGLHLHYQLASAAGFFAGLVAGFGFNKNWTYQEANKATPLLWAKYVAVYGLSLLASLALLYGLVDRLGMDARLANLLGIVLTTCTNFIGTKFFVFRK